MMGWKSHSSPQTTEKLWAKPQGSGRVRYSSGTLGAWTSLASPMGREHCDMPHLNVLA